MPLQKYCFYINAYTIYDCLWITHAMNLYSIFLMQKLMHIELGGWSKGSRIFFKGEIVAMPVFHVRLCLCRWTSTEIAHLEPSLAKALHSEWRKVKLSAGWVMDRCSLRHTALPLEMWMMHSVWRPHICGVKVSHFVQRFLLFCVLSFLKSPFSAGV